jgi:uncharacterized protein YndB with AHSA1/START domain
MTDPTPTESPTRTIDLSVEVPGTPEEVWNAIATGPGISSWFIPCGVEEREGGAVTMDFGSYGEETAKVTAWEPPRRVVFEGPGGKDDGRTLAYEWLVEARGGDTCVVRLVNSGFGAGAEWDGDYDGMSQGWRLFLENLRLHLTHFRGQHARALTPMAQVPGPNAAAWEAHCTAIGVSPDLQAGDRLLATGDGVPPLAGVVDIAERSESISQYRLLLEAPTKGTAFVAAEGGGDQVTVSVWLYLYGDEVPGEDRWAAWFAEHHPAPSPAPADA